MYKKTVLFKGAGKFKERTQHNYSTKAIFQ